MLKIVALNKIIVSENRQRKLFSETKIEQLAESIRARGLLHAPVVREKPDGSYTLVAGERRLRAVTSLSQLDLTFSCGGEPIPSGHIPVLPIGSLDPISAKEAELEENIIREDLSWQERAEATKELHDLKRQQAGEAPIPKKHTVTDTAKIIAGDEYSDSARIAVANTLVVADHLNDPDVAKAKSEGEALKVIKKKATQEHRRKLAETFSSSESKHTILKGDCLEILPTLAAHTFDCIIIDPPYGIGANNFGEQSSTGHDYEDSKEYFDSFIGRVLSELYRVAKAQAHLYLFFDPRMYEQIKLEAELAGWDVWHVPLIWNKLNGMLPRPEHGPRRTYEMILFASKGNKTVSRVAPDVLTYPQDAQIQHGAQKPVPLYEDLMSRSVDPGNTVLDCFAGSGPIFPAADKCFCTAVGIERSEDSYALCVERINEQGISL
jgi:DNA modification methylase